MYPRVAEYVPSELPVLLTATILEAIPALLEQHDRYDQIQLTEYLAQVFPEIPEVLRGPVVVAATAGARHAALMHGICEKNTLSEDPRKRRFAAEAASSLSFWALGLRAPHRSAIAVPCASVSTPFAECCMSSSTMASGRMSVSSLVTLAQLPHVPSRAATPLVSPPAEYLPGWVFEGVSVGSHVNLPQLSVVASGSLASPPAEPSLASSAMVSNTVTVSSLMADIQLPVPIPSVDHEFDGVYSESPLFQSMNQLLSPLSSGSLDMVVSDSPDIMLVSSADVAQATVCLGDPLLSDSAAVPQFHSTQQPKVVLSAKDRRRADLNLEASLIQEGSPLILSVPDYDTLDEDLSSSVSVVNSSAQNLVDFTVETAAGTTLVSVSAAVMSAAGAFEVSVTPALAPKVVSSVMSTVCKSAMTAVIPPPSPCSSRLLALSTQTVKKNAMTQGKAVPASVASCPKTVSAFSDSNRQVVPAGSNSRSKQSSSVSGRKSTESTSTSRKRPCDQAARHHSFDGVFRSVRQITMSHDEYRCYQEFLDARKKSKK